VLADNIFLLTEKAGKIAIATEEALKQHTNI